MKILIIGGTGFLGSRVAERLASDHQVALLHQGITHLPFLKGIQEIIGNRLELEKVKEKIAAFAPEVILDIILSSGKQASDLLNVCRGIAKRVIAISSCDVYQAFDVFLGRSSREIPTPLTEASPLRDQFYLYKNMDLTQFPAWVGSDYEKIDVERVIMTDADIQGTVIRLPMIYGPGDIQRRFSNIIEWQKNDQDILLDEQTANWHGPWGYVDNVIEAIYLATIRQEAAGQIYHVADSPALSYSEIVKQFGVVSDWKGRLDISPDEYLPTNLKTIFKAATIQPQQNLSIDISKISRELGFKRIVPEKEAFYHTYQWLSSANL